MSLVDLIAQADERELAACALACLDRCVVLLGDDDESLRPLWAALARGSDWAEPLEQMRSKLDAEGGKAFAEDEATLLARRMLAAVPASWSALEVRGWADTCSVASLQIHRLLDPAQEGKSSVDACREGCAEGISPLVAAELRRQIAVLELLAEHGSSGLRAALEVSTEGRRVLRAVVSRRARRRV
ncbi:hypothetical protein ACPCAA_09405 [Streptomyces griseoincarnatus]